MANVWEHYLVNWCVFADKWLIKVYVHWKKVKTVTITSSWTPLPQTLLPLGRSTRMNTQILQDIHLYAWGRTAEQQLNIINASINTGEQSGQTSRAFAEWPEHCPSTSRSDRPHWAASPGKDSNDLIFSSIYWRVCQVSPIWTREVWICMFMNWLPPHRVL